MLTISPLDDELFVKSAKKSGRVVIVHEAPRSFGPGAEIVSRIMEKAFYYLEVPIARVTGYDLHPPLFGREKAFIPDAQRIVRAAKRVLKNE
jgi:pyruvate dehydrogenase E1 component beta subunit